MRRFLYSQGRFIEAEREFYRVTEDTLYSGRPMAFVNLGLCRLQLEDNQLVPRRPSPGPCSMDRRNPVALLELGFLRLEAGDTDEAARYHGVPTGRSLHSNRRGGCYSVWKSPIKQAIRMRWVVMSWHCAICTRILPSTGSGWSVRVDNEYSVKEPDAGGQWP